MSRTYCVVGGGISGLVAALRLRQFAGADADIVLFDPSDRLGGVLRTETIAGAPMDVGAEAFVARRPEMPALLAELGLSNRHIGTTGVRPSIYSQGRLHPLPPGAVNGIPADAASVTGLVDPATVARIASEADRPLSWRPGSDPAVGDLVGDRFGAQVVTRSVDPMLSGVYAGSAASIGLRSAVPTVAAALDAGAGSLTAAVRRAQPGPSAGPVFGAVEGGYRVLLEALLERSGLRWVQAPVTGITADGERWDVADGTGAHWCADGVVLAVSAPRTAALLARIAPRSAAAAAGIPVASAAVLALATPPGTPFPPQSGVLVATGEVLHAKAITLSSRKWGTGGGPEFVRMSFGRFGDGIATDVPDDVLVTWALADLDTVFGIRPQPLQIRVHRWIDALPQYGPGHAGVAAEVRSGLPAGLSVCGNFLDGVGVPACVGAAEKAVAVVVGAAAR